MSRIPSLSVGHPAPLARILFPSKPFSLLYVRTALKTAFPPLSMAVG